jgi:endonuclease III
MVHSARKASPITSDHRPLSATKAKNVAALSRLLLERHGGEVPHDREALEALPGVGRKTANVVLNTVFGEPTIAVDTHIFRVGNRTGLATGQGPRGRRAGADEGACPPNSACTPTTG